MSFILLYVQDWQAKFQSAFFFLWEMEEEKGSSGRQMKYFIFKKEEKESQEIMKWV